MVAMTVEMRPSCCGCYCVPLQQTMLHTVLCLFAHLKERGRICVGLGQVLNRLGFENSTVRKTVASQTRVLLFYYWVTYCVLRAKKPQFQPMESVVTGTI